ncbi:MAG: S9 family peptidase, partial [Hoeflea sp.]|nr:S9 family peptidase [Hoeflea sp.]
MSVFKNLPAAPVAEKRPVTDIRHGVSRTDDYAWMRDDAWQEMFQDPSILDPAIRAHLEAENAYQQAAMADTEALQKTLFAEMRGRIKEDDSSVPAPDGPWLYGVRYVTGGEQPKHFRIPRKGGDEQMLLDGDLEAEGKAYFRLAGAG